MKFKFFLPVAVLALAVLYFFPVPSVVAQSNTASDCLQLSSESQKMSCLQNIINQLSTQIQAFLGQQGWCHTFNINLGYANSGNPEVGYLHTALNKQGFSYAPDTGNTYSEGTAFAVTKFQEKYASEILAPYGLTKGTGFMGVKTRQKLNELYACRTSGTPVTPVTPSTITQQSLIAVTSPNSPITWTKGGTYTVTWSSLGITGYVSIILKDDARQSAGAIWSVNNVFNSGYYSFILPSFSSITPGNKYRICVNHANTSDCGDSYISIVDSTTTTDTNTNTTTTTNTTTNTNTVTDTTTPPVAITCSETDNAFDYYAKGTATGKNIWDGLSGSYTDTCSGSTLTEYQCLNNRVAKTSYNCSNGCSNGACSAISPVCAENDSGPYSYGVQGTTTGKNNWDGSIGFYADYCTGVILTEYQCSKGLVEKANYYTCSNGCVNGACLLSNVISMASPFGGEIWERGAVQKIEWAIYDPDVMDPYIFDINLTDNNGASYDIAKSVGGLLYNWTVGDAINAKNSIPNGDYYKMRVCRTGTSICGSYSAYFSIIDPVPPPPPATITLTSPNGGWFNEGDLIPIKWSYSGLDENYLVDVYLEGTLSYSGAQVNKKIYGQGSISDGYVNWKAFDIGYFRIKLQVIDSSYNPISGAEDYSDGQIFINSP